MPSGLADTVGTSPNGLEAKCWGFAYGSATGNHASHGAPRLDQEQFEVSINSGATPVIPRVPLWIGLIFSLPLQGVILWFLVRNKAAFAPPTQQHTA